MIGSIALKVEVLSGSHIETIAKNAIEMRNMLRVPLNLCFDRCEILVMPFTTEEEIIEEFKEY